MICINIKYGCGHLGVATFAIEILRMSEIALDPHLMESESAIFQDLQSFGREITYYNG